MDNSWRQFWRSAQIGVLGVVFGDIGTSPLYALKQSVLASGALIPNQADILGLLSLIFWAITLIVTIKYVLLVLRVDNDGEGGLLALVGLLRLHQLTDRRSRWALLIGLMGAAMLFGDGVITSAISVLSAVEGLQVIEPDLAEWIVPLTIAILAGLFIAQRSGTDRIGGLFGPVMLIWFVTLGLLGLIQIIGNPSVLRALNPVYAVHALQTSPIVAAAILGAVFLAVTGAEALYADMGAYGRPLIQRAWLFFVMPCLVLNYFGQGALLLARPDALANPFYQLAPDWLGVPLLILATMATVIASQAMITGVFAVSKHAMELGYFPPMQSRHTSAHNIRHIFIAPINWLMMLAAIIIVAEFGTSDRLGAAYGIAVAASMVANGVLFSMAMPRVFDWPRWAIQATAVFAIGISVVFLLANLTKIGHGGWLPIAMGGVVFLVMQSWRRGVRDLIKVQVAQSEPLAEFVTRRADAGAVRLPPTGIFFSRSAYIIPVPMARLAQLLDLRLNQTVIVTMSVQPRPTIPHEEKVVLETIDETHTRALVQFGYLETTAVLPNLLPALQRAGIDTDNLVFIIGHERILPPERIRSLRDVMDWLFAFLARNAARSVDRFGLPARRTLEVGYSVRLGG